MKDTIKSVSIVLSLVCFPIPLYAQMQGLHGDDTETRIGLHSGNQFVTTFYNDGTFGAYYPTSADEIEGEWPKGSGHYYLLAGSIFIGSEVKTNDGQFIHILSENKSYSYPGGGGRGDVDPITQEWWTFLPLPGFANPTGKKIAMVKGREEWNNSWPISWPDIADPSNPRHSPDGWAGAWNGYYGRNRVNADEESYFVVDDYMNREFMDRFIPDSSNPDRGGLGVRVYTRGWQFANPEMENGLFIHYELENIGTYNHDKMVFGYNIENNMGQDKTGADAGDDYAAFIRDSNGVAYNLAYTWDADDHGASGWKVGYLGGAMLETPGNPYDGIDNDNDGHDVKANVPGSGTGDEITEALFNRGTLQLNTTIVLIDYSTPVLQRKITTFGAALAAAGKIAADTLIVTNGVRENKFWVGKKLAEDSVVFDNITRTGVNLFDDNLNGLIDENRGVSDFAGSIQYLYIGHRAINYFNGAGKDNWLIDERHDNGKDDDGDWNSATDDVGADGLGSNSPGYPGADAGEGDGLPTVGEPRFDKTDIDESDQLGLTSCNLYLFGNPNNQYDDERFWFLMHPGIFSTQTFGNVELLFGSGYFSLPPGHTELVSVGLICGSTLSEVIETITHADEMFENNYLLPTKPDVPTLQATSYNGKVTLSWDDIAEKSNDPVLGADFEGYRIYRTTAPYSFDTASLVAQFDLDNQYAGYAPTSINGKYFWLGENSGLKHSWVDSSVTNGTIYYYAVTSYDHGDSAFRYPPAECSIRIVQDGLDITYVSKNAAVVKPVDPDAGNYSPTVKPLTGVTDGIVACEIIDSRSVKSNHSYRVTFEDSLFAISPAQKVTRTNRTESFTLTDITNGNVLINKFSILQNPASYHIVDGFRLSIQNTEDPLLRLDSIMELKAEWNREGIPDWLFRTYESSIVKPISGDFDIVFGNVGLDTSKPFYGMAGLYPAMPVNFKIIITSTNQEVDFAFRDRDTSRGGPGVFAWGAPPAGRGSDEIIFLTKHSHADSLIASWWIRFNIPSGNQDTSVPRMGDFLSLKFNKPLLSDNVFEFTMPDIPLEVEEINSKLPAHFSLSQNYPNPFNPSTTIEFTLPKKSFVTLKIYDLIGREVATVVSEELNADTYKRNWNALGMASGLYFYRIQAGNFVETKKLLFLK